MIPARIKSSGNYVNSILAKTEATLAGFDEAIILNQDGHVCEGSGRRIFSWSSAASLVTPVLEDNSLPGITRETIMQVAQSDLGLEVVERTIDRSELYLAEEIFLTGTAAHLTPVVELDSRPIAGRQARTGFFQAAEDVLRHRVRPGSQISSLVHRRRA